MLLANPVPVAAELPAELHERLLAGGLALLAERGIVGRDVTPTLLEHFHTESGGASLDTNEALVLANATLAAEVAAALAAADRRSRSRVSSCRHAAGDRLLSEPPRKRDRLGSWAAGRGSWWSATPAWTSSCAPTRCPPRAARARVTVSAGGAGANTAAWLAASAPAPRWWPGSAPTPPRAGCAPSSPRPASGPPSPWTADAPTCQVVVIVDATGQRTMLADRGAAARLAPADVGGLAGAAHLHLSGYVLLDPSSRPAGRAALAAARAASLTTSVDPQAAALLADPRDFLADVAGVDLLLPSAAELAALGDGALRAARAVAVTAGADGATWMDGTTRVHVPAEPVAVADSTGAGDAFDAGLLAAWLAGATPSDALRAGVAAATRAVGRLGARP